MNKMIIAAVFAGCLAGNAAAEGAAVKGVDNSNNEQAVFLAVKGPAVVAFVASPDGGDKVVLGYRGFGPLGGAKLLAAHIKISYSIDGEFLLTAEHRNFYVPRREEFGYELARLAAKADEGNKRGLLPATRGNAKIEVIELAFEISGDAGGKRQRDPSFGNNYVFTAVEIENGKKFTGTSSSETMKFIKEEIRR